MYRYFPGESISKIHGQPRRVGDRLIVPMFHPAAALHQPKWRPQITEDFRKLPGLIAAAAAFRQPEDQEIDSDNAEQLSLSTSKFEKGGTPTCRPEPHVGVLACAALLPPQKLDLLSLF